MRMLISNLIKNKKVKPENILYINKEIHDFDFINTDQKLSDVLKIYESEIKPKGKKYLFLDEIQEINNWEKIINSLSQDYTQNYEIIITGSNANLLSTELSTYLSGRYVKFIVYSYSYTEFLEIKKMGAASNLGTICKHHAAFFKIL